MGNKFVYIITITIINSSIVNSGLGKMSINFSFNLLFLREKVLNLINQSFILNQKILLNFNRDLGKQINMELINILKIEYYKNSLWSWIKKQMKCLEK